LSIFRRSQNWRCRSGDRTAAKTDSITRDNTLNGLAVVGGTVEVEIMVLGT